MNFTEDARHSSDNEGVMFFGIVETRPKLCFCIFHCLVGYNWGFMVILLGRESAFASQTGFMARIRERDKTNGMDDFFSRKTVLSTDS